MTRGRTVLHFNHQGAPEAFLSRLRPMAGLSAGLHYWPQISHMTRHREVERSKGRAPVRQRPGEVALDVRVHDGLEVLEFAVLQEVDDVDLRNGNISVENTLVCCLEILLRLL